MRSVDEANDHRAANLALRLYRRLAESFPHEFKLAYGADLLETGEDAVEEIARRHGTLGLVRLIADISFRVPIGYASEMLRDLRYAGRALRKSPGFALVTVGTILGFAGAFEELPLLLDHNYHGAGVGEF